MQDTRVWTWTGAGSIGVFLVLLVCLASPLAAGANEPRDAFRLAGEAAKYTPLGFEPRLFLSGRVEGHDGLVVDADGTRYEHDAAVNTSVRIGLRRDERLSWARLLVEYEHELVAGVLTGGGDLEGRFVPNTGGYEEHALRKLSLGASFGPWLTVSGGFTTSHWGLGLIANDGDHGFLPKSASFLDPRGGDRVLRALLATGPHTSQRVVVFGAFDQVRHDDVLFPGDEAIQAVGGIRVGDLAPLSGEPTSYEAGIYGVWRRQEASDGQRTEVGVVDLYGRYRHALSGGMALEVAFEGAAIVGTTELAPNPDFPEHDVFQLGGALRVDFDGGLAGARLDVLYASGDQNADDAGQNGFRVDINHDMGLLLYRQVIAAQTARSPITAADTDLVGVPNEDLERLATRGQITNTVAFFPRGWVRPFDGLEIYGGVLIALAEVAYADAFNTRIAGGDPRNPAGGKPGAYYGTEFDAGVRFRTLLYGSEISLGLEGGVLLPGSAFEDASGSTPGALFGGRAMAHYRF